MNVKFHKNCENTGKILRISCARCNVCEISHSFFGFQDIFFGVVTGGGHPDLEIGEGEGGS